MDTHDSLIAQWLDIKARLYDKQLLRHREQDGPAPSVSVRCPGTRSMLFSNVPDTAARRLSIDAPDHGANRADDIADVHAAIYRLRNDIGAIAYGGGRYGSCLADFSGAIPILFDEQARHLGRMGAAVDHVDQLAHSLSRGGNSVLFRGEPVCFGTTCQRMALNAELFEKCAEAYVLAAAAGSRMTLLPWLVRFVANRRLRKDQQRATESFAAGMLPPESRGY
ncbi:hypothetical protein FSO04_42965 [Paraburkholderia madseniana]|uniref:Uncharacterized protein n=1 Tax=Paraburkholderia madseniana TaxID=2599607 RepID=A0A6N6W028_9BURK|nr:hypothetical protein [Paraburkholderia madseniana]KAE8753833.1 hypothetical protein FSO04_42965 [Paraburkholderia madseniana]